MPSHRSNAEKENRRVRDRKSRSRERRRSRSRERKRSRSPRYLLQDRNGDQETFETSSSRRHRHDRQGSSTGRHKTGHSSDDKTFHQMVQTVVRSMKTESLASFRRELQNAKLREPKVRRVRWGRVFERIIATTSDSVVKRRARGIVDEIRIEEEQRDMRASMAYGLILEMKQPKRNMSKILSSIASLPQGTTSTHFRNELGLPLLGRRKALVMVAKSMYVNYAFAIGHPVEEKRQLTMIHGSPGAGKSLFLSQFLRAFLSDAIAMEMFLRNDLSIQDDDIPQLCWDAIVRGVGNSMPTEVYLRVRFLNSLFASLIRRKQISANIGLMNHETQVQNARTVAQGVMQSAFLTGIAENLEQLPSGEDVRMSLDCILHRKPNELDMQQFPMLLGYGKDAFEAWVNLQGEKVHSHPPLCEGVEMDRITVITFDECQELMGKDDDRGALYHLATYFLPFLQPGSSEIPLVLYAASNTMNAWMRFDLTHYVPAPTTLGPVNLATFDDMLLLGTNMRRSKLSTHDSEWVENMFQQLAGIPRQLVALLTFLRNNRRSPLADATDELRMSLQYMIDYACAAVSSWTIQQRQALLLQCSLDVGFTGVERPIDEEPLTYDDLQNAGLIYPINDGSMGAYSARQVRFIPPFLIPHILPKHQMVLGSIDLSALSSVNASRIARNDGRHLEKAIAHSLYAKYALCARQHDEPLPCISLSEILPEAAGFGDHLQVQWTGVSTLNKKYDYTKTAADLPQVDEFSVMLMTPGNAGFDILLLAHEVHDGRRLRTIKIGIDAKDWRVERISAGTIWKSASKCLAVMGQDRADHHIDRLLVWNAYAQKGHTPTELTCRQRATESQADFTTRKQETTQCYQALVDDRFVLASRFPWFSTALRLVVIITIDIGRAALPPVSTSEVSSPQILDRGGKCIIFVAQLCDNGRFKDASVSRSSTSTASRPH
ncbi:hypothetical protein BC832DRAFT_541882 [Gaertneriomyces semiglobifer]|nr:hypothetical protein BC832DRAFT_541882 [Gaertneriomyces semiglobifer]